MALFKRLAARAREGYRRMSIQLLLSLSFTAVALAGIAFMGASLLLRFSDSAQSLTQEATQRVLAQVNMNLDSHLRRMMRVSDTVYYRIIKKTDLTQRSMGEAMSLLYEENRDALVSIAVFNEGGGLETAVPLSSIKPTAFPNESSWFCLALERMENLHFSTPHIQELFDDPDHPYRWVVSLSRHVQLTRDGNTERGVLLVDMNFSGIAQVCRDIELPNGGYVYLTDRSGELIYHPRQQLIYSGLLEENNLTAAGYPDGSHHERFQGQEREVTVKTVGYTGWKLVGVVPAGQ
ncbi:MAG: cache domain-containing protein, partial [Oscillospiraceae bacterium]|nr:cache domain-containing protein [Oscillospiraceae bacterium]